MLDRDLRAAILLLHGKGHGKRTIARTLKVSRNSVRTVIEQATAEVPPLERPESGAEHIDEIRRLYVDCEGNLARVHEELCGLGIDIPYSTLTGLCRRHEIGRTPKQRSGQYHFEPGREMQHDTSPHEVTIGGKKRLVQCAQVVMCFSRMRYAQVYLVWDRFHAKIFLTEALVYFGGAAVRCMLDNSTVIMAKGTGKNAVPAPEMAAFAERFGFDFVAHAVGDANRSARVERPFHEIETNFYKGRTFADIADLNRQMHVWCEQRSRKYRRELKASPIELFATERPHIKALPIYIPEVYRLHYRLVSVEGYVHLHTNRYSVDAGLIGRQVEVRESKDRVRIFHKHNEAALHIKAEPGANHRSTLEEHRYDGRWQEHRRERPAEREEMELRAAADALGRMVDELRKRFAGHASRAIRRLHRMYIDYPTEPLVKAVEQALRFGLYDTVRIETMVLKSIAGDFFRLLPGTDDEEPHG